jgi:hypothetical protein
MNTYGGASHGPNTWSKRNWNNYVLPPRPVSYRCSSAFFDGLSVLPSPPKILSQMAHPRSLETGVCSELIHLRSSSSPYGLHSSHAKVTLCFLAGFQPSEFGKTYTAPSISGYSCHVDHFRGFDFQLVAQTSVLGNVFWLHAGRRDAGSPI